MSLSPKDVKAIFDSVVELPTQADREAKLIAACSGNPDLQAKVQALLNAFDQADSFLESPPPGLIRAQANLEPTAELSRDRQFQQKAGNRVGPYKLLQQIGEGGMGTVYMAEQSKPVERRVALKIIKPGMDSKQVIARFEAERQALAMMDHPNIAKVLDAGETEGGHPYFVMELVKGVPITEYCDEHHLTPKERLELFLPVLYAVQHAHQKGIIHRDLKPTNVLVAEYDHQAVPKVIDFGVAKATHQKLTDKTMFTQYGQLVGTFEYMSPEQAKLNQMDIDTRSDIYSLGVLLYELLTGDTPLDRLRLRSAAFDELLRIIREEEPPMPSTRLSTSTSLPALSANRGMDSKKLSALLQGELDWIVMKAIDKDRSRRYESPNSFAEDIQRYLNQEAIAARPASTAYRLRKFARRNLVAVVSGGAIATALLLGIVASTWMAIREHQAKSLAQELAAEADTQFNRAVNAKVEAENERNAAEMLSRELARKNDELKQQKDAQRRTAYIGQMKLIQKAWDLSQFDRVGELLNATRPGPGESDVRGPEWFFWQRKIHPEEDAVRVLAHSRSSAFSHDARLLAYVDYAQKPNCKIVVQDTGTGKVLIQKEIPQPPMTLAELVHVDDNRIAVAMVPRRNSPGSKASTATLSVFHRDSMELAMTAQAFSYESENPFYFSRDGERVAAAIEDSVVQVWDSNTGESVAQVPVSVPQDFSQVALLIGINSDGTKLAIRPKAKSNFESQPLGISIVEPLTGATVVTPPVRASLPYFTPDGMHVLCSDGQTVSTFDTASGHKLHSFAHAGALASKNSSAISPNGRWLALQFEGGFMGTNRSRSRIEIVDAATGEVADVIKGYSGYVASTAFSGDSSQLLTDHPQGKGIVRWPLLSPFSNDSENEDEPVLAWRTMSSEEGGRWQAQVNDISGLPMTATTDPDQFSYAIDLIDNTGANDVRRLPVANHRVIKTFSPDGRYLVTICVNQKAELSNAGELKVWETKTGNNVLSLRLQTRTALARGSELKVLGIDLRKYIAFSPINSQIAIAFPANEPTLNYRGPMQVRIWDLASGNELTPRDKVISAEHPSQIAFSANGEKLIVLRGRPTQHLSGGIERMKLLAFDVKTGNVGWEHDIRSYCSVCTPNNSLVVSIVDEDGATHAVGHSTETGMEVFRRPWNSDKNLTFVASDDLFTQVALVSAGRTYIIDVNSPQEHLTLDGEKVLNVSFNVKQNRIITSIGESHSLTAERTARLAFGERPRGIAIWDSQSGQELLTVRLPSAVKTWSAQSALIQQNQQGVRLGGRFFWSTAPLSEETEANELLVAARSLLTNPKPTLGSHDRAIHFLTEAIRLNPNLPDARNLMALGHLQRGSPTEALNAMGVNGNESETSATSSAEELTLRAVEKHLSGRHAEARQLMEQAQKTASESEAVWQLLMQQAKEQLGIPAAEQNAQSWMGHKFMPRSLRSELTLPCLVTKVENDRLWVGKDTINCSEVVSLVDSIEYYTSLIESHPKSAIWWNHRGIAYERLGEYDKAIVDYTQAIELRKDPAYFANRGFVYLSDKKLYELAMADFIQAIEIDEKYTSVNSCIICTLRRMGKPEEALVKADEAIRLDRISKIARSGSYHCERAYIHAVLGNVDSMRADFESAIRLDPNDHYNWLAKAWLLATSTVAEHRDGKQAVEAATKACELTFWKDEDALEHLAAAYAESGDFATATQWQAKAIEYAPPARRPKFESRLKLFSSNTPVRESLAQ